MSAGNGSGDESISSPSDQPVAQIDGDLEFLNGLHDCCPLIWLVIDNADKLGRGPANMIDAPRVGWSLRL
jgi:hypothetical protein